MNTTACPAACRLRPPGGAMSTPVPCCKPALRKSCSPGRNQRIAANHHKEHARVHQQAARQAPAHASLLPGWLSVPLFLAVSNRRAACATYFEKLLAGRGFRAPNRAVVGTIARLGRQGEPRQRAPQPWQSILLILGDFLPPGYELVLAAGVQHAGALAFYMLRRVMAT